MLSVSSLKDKAVVSFGRAGARRLERVKMGGSEWSALTGGGFVPLSLLGAGAEPVPVNAADYVDSSVGDGLYEYRARDFSFAGGADEGWEESVWVRCGESGPAGYTFGNWRAPEGSWGAVATPDDLRYTYLWGTDFRAANGASYTDAQIQFFIDGATDDMARRLNIDIRKTRRRSRAAGLSKGADYDREEAPYDFKFSKISRYGVIKTRGRPIIALRSLRLLDGAGGFRELSNSTVVDKERGTLKTLERPVKPSETARGIQAAVGMYGTESPLGRVFYEIDYDTGYETSDDVPGDLREAIAKRAAVSLLNIIGDGLMSGFSSSSLSLDGMSESFSSTQSATSAYFGARIAEYKKDIDDYLKANRGKFSNVSMGAI